MSRKMKDTAPRVPAVLSRVSQTTEDGNPAWVGWIQDWVRPAVAVIVLVMSAPGEHYLAQKAGWADWLAWGMPAVLTMYAGVAAVVATKRPKGAEGKATAVVGAGLSIVLAMAAQPFAHLLKSGWEPGMPWTFHQTLTVVVSCIPALVFGHLLHLAASPTVNGVLSRVMGQAEDKDTAEDTVSPKAVPAPLSRPDVPVSPVDVPVSLEKVVPAVPAVPAAVSTPRVTVPVPAPLSRPDVPVSPVDVPTVPAADPESQPVSPVDVPAAVPSAVPGPRVLANGSMSGFVKAALSRDMSLDDDTLRDMVLSHFGQDTKPNTVNKTIRRARLALSA